jgi:hypothetical protein
VYTSTSFCREVEMEIPDRRLRRLGRSLGLVFLAALLGGPVLGQGALSLSSAAVPQGGTATLNLALSSPGGSEPAGVP